MLAQRKIFLMHERNQAALEKLHREDHDAEHDDIQAAVPPAPGRPRVALRDRVKMAASFGVIFSGSSCRRRVRRRVGRRNGWAAPRDASGTSCEDDGIGSAGPPGPTHRRWLTVPTGTGTERRYRAHEHPYTLSIDIGGTGLKANVLGAGGDMVADRVKIPTTYPLPPDLMVEKLDRAGQEAAGGRPRLVRLPRHGAQGPRAQRAALRDQQGPGHRIVPELVKAWSDFDLASALSTSIGVPCRVANDADVQGAGRRRGPGLRGRHHARHRFRHRLLHGRPAAPPHRARPPASSARARPSTSSSANRPARRSATSAGTSGCGRRSPTWTSLTFFDHLYIGGGNAQRVNRRDLGEVLERITVVDNSAGILGGIKLWEPQHIAAMEGDIAR